MPAALVGLFFALRQSTGTMDWVVEHISAPVRRFTGLVSSVYPLSMMEILIAAAIIWLIYYLIKTIMVSSRRRGKIKIILKRLLPVVVAAVYVWAVFSWLWSSGYHASRFSEKNGFTGGGVSVESLRQVTQLFADKANELAPLAERDEAGHYAVTRAEIFEASTEIYHNLTMEFPGLDGRLYQPKPMIFSWLMSRTGYTGIYFAITGESNINTGPPEIMMPSTVAHELAHQLGVFAEDEANFVGILACITSENIVYEYSGYLLGLVHLMNALHGADYEAWVAVYNTLAEEILTDWRDNAVYWESQKTAETRIDFLDRFLTWLFKTSRETVDVVYDGYLKSNRQELGLRSYGACVDLLIEFFESGRFEPQIYLLID